jgi:hypothetical protein
MNNKLLILYAILMSYAVIAQVQQHDYVDLGLPSGTLWATCNVGANNPEDAGDYFAWGETSPKSFYDWETYKYANGDYDKLTKYCQKSAYGYNGYSDDIALLERSDDAATVNWGSDWCMPTRYQFMELKNKCTWTWITRNGKSGYEVKGANGNSIFLPAAGAYYNTKFIGYGTEGHYWSSTLSWDNPVNSFFIDFDSDNVNPMLFYRAYGWSVRPVRCKK